MEEIGCHFKFEEISGNKYHDTNLLLSSGRNCLRYIINERNVKKIFLPYFLCESLSEVAKDCGISIEYYHLDEKMLPKNIEAEKFDNQTYLYFVNYYGILKDEINNIVSEYKNIIVDNTHDFFNQTSYDSDTIYNYRKYFGVPDGACIISDLARNSEIKIGNSKEKIIEMVARDETKEFFHYPSFLEADKHFRNEELRYMSNFTSNYLNAIDYQEIKEKRINNYKILFNELKQYNDLDLSQKELTYMYPLLVSEGDLLRKALGEKNIYSQKLWPNVLWNGSDENEIRLANDIVLLPIDQRYGEEEMEYMIDVVEKYCRKRK